jgi:hypothetical protein
MGAWRHRLANPAIPVDQTLNGKQLLGRDGLVVPSRQEEQGTAQGGEIDVAAESYEAARGQLVLLEQLFDRLQIVCPGQIESGGLPLAEASRDCREGRRVDRVGGL